MSARDGSLQSLKERVESFSPWYHRIELAPGVITPGVNDTNSMLRNLELPPDLRGLRALDIGARDGFFSFELEKRGAEVLALDYLPMDQTGFSIAKEALGSKVRYQVANVYEITPERFGQFDIVLFLGVLYHLRNPLLAFDRIRSVCRDRMWLETQLIDNAFLTESGELVPLGTFGGKLLDIPLMQFYPRNSLNRDFSNWWAPNMVCLRAMLEDANFSVEGGRIDGPRGILRCRVRTPDDSDAEYVRQLESLTARERGLAEDSGKS